MRRLAARTHEHDHALGLGMARVIEEVILAAGELGEPLHGLFHDPRAAVIERIARLARLEEHVRVLRRAAQHRLVGRERARDGAP